MATDTRPPSRGDARATVLTMAREAFGRDGYHGATLRQIARSSQVSEAILYRYFPGKQALFRAAVEEPFEGFVDEFVAEWERLGADIANDEMVTLFVLRLHEFTLRNRDLLYAMVTAGQDTPQALTAGIRRLALYTRTQAEHRGITDVDLEMAVAHTVGTVLASVLHRGLLFGPEVPPERALRELAKYAAAGVQQSHP